MPRPALILRAPDPGEHELQINCTRMLRTLLLPDVAWTAIDHGHSLDKSIGRHGKPIALLEGMKRRARGIKPGIPDFLFWHRERSFAIELKDLDGVLSDDQKDFLRALIASGTAVKVCWTQSQVLYVTRAWGLLRKLRVAA